MKKMFFLFLFSVLAFSCLKTNSSLATGPAAIISWKSNSYVPSEYKGRALPIAKSAITISLDVLNGGSPVDLSAYDVIWYVNDSVSQSGSGLVRITAYAPDIPGDNFIKVRVEVPSYGPGGISKAVYIPVVGPIAVINAPYPKNEFSSFSINVSALPYFWNVADPSGLAFSWSVNGVKPQTHEDPTALNINVTGDAGIGSAMSLSLGVSNAAQANESSFTTISLTYAK